MKKTFFLFLMLATMTSSVWADSVGKRLTLSELKEGQKVIIEAASTSNNYEYYIKAVGNYYAWKQGLDTDCIWVLVHSDKTKYGETDTYFFQHLRSGKYMGGVYLTSCNSFFSTDFFLLLAKKLKLVWVKLTKKFIFFWEFSCFNSFFLFLFLFLPIILFELEIGFILLFWEL